VPQQSDVKSPPPRNPFTKLWRRVMRMTVEQLDDYRRRRKERGKVTIIPPNAVVPKTPSDVSATTAQSATIDHWRVADGRGLGGYRPETKNSPATISIVFGLVAGAIGLAFTGVGLTIGWRYTGSTATGLDGYLMAILGLCIDAGAVVGLGIAAKL